MLKLPRARVLLAVLAGLVALMVATEFWLNAVLASLSVDDLIALAGTPAPPPYFLQVGSVYGISAVVGLIVYRLLSDNRWKWIPVLVAGIGTYLAVILFGLRMVELLVRNLSW